MQVLGQQPGYPNCIALLRTCDQAACNTDLSYMPRTVRINPLQRGLQSIASFKNCLLQLLPRVSTAAPVGFQAAAFMVVYQKAWALLFVPDAQM